MIEITEHLKFANIESGSITLDDYTFCKDFHIDVFFFENHYQLHVILEEDDEDFSLYGPSILFESCNEQIEENADKIREVILKEMNIIYENFTITDPESIKTTAS